MGESRRADTRTRPPSGQRWGRGVGPRLRSSPHPRALSLAVAVTALVYWLLRWTPEEWPDASYGPKADDVHWKLGMASGSATLVLLAATLAIRPLRTLRGRRTPIHVPLRRALGIWSAIWAAVHSVFGVTIHAAGWDLLRPFRTAVNAQGTGRLLGLALVVGTGTLLVLVALAAISSDAALRRLGRHRWKRAQQMAYLGGLGAVVHVVGIQIWEGRTLAHAIALLAVPTAVIGLRVMPGSRKDPGKAPVS